MVKTVSVVNSASPAVQLFCACGEYHVMVSQDEVQALRKQDKQMLNRCYEEITRLTAIVHELEGLENA